ncbi:exo 1,3/1,4-beta-D-glucan glucohydrolase [Xanthomonas sp. AM6]|uniref:glycoside hydrolase family 3 protein n=1 Tax=Xanthomonas sp. AM6 TaxID=2982531 RepID=UPI0021D94414|nr:glycoside hydrolase family 3 protein [Xanthomonas sp. AM6]UYB53732.1 exo 1,3/1,4-beta-D-glucan glucohydrolase [Xanthomonas sp. AM6]
MSRPHALARAMLAAVTLAAAAEAAPPSAPPAPLRDWPALRSAVAPDPAIEARVAQILGGMTLAQKVGQMTQAEIKSITPEQVRQYHIGSVLNGGGSWPGKDKHARVGDWLRLADAYYRASMSTDAAVPIPIIWGTDAVHGHSNVYGATLFPHNIGLGAARDPALVEQVARATAQGSRATGIAWAFAPTLAVAEDTRWGRTYESFSSDPALVREYGAAYVRGMQGRLGDDASVLATAKHYLGDGATEHGQDQGVARIDKARMLNVHGQGYYGAIAAGVQTVMASYSSWNDVAAGVDYGKMHGAAPLLSEALKQKMGFDGFVVSDWNGIGQVPGCSNASCAQAINAGMDMVMVPDDWKAFIDNTVAQVQAGQIPQARIDDAVRRILRVKLRAGLFAHAPSASRYAGREDALLHRELARRAVRESLVLLKNEQSALPLRRGQRLLVVGKSADRIADQAGGWSLTWQGTDNGNADFPNAQSILAGLREVGGAERVRYAESVAAAAPGSYDAIVAVIGETPYAEGSGDIVASSTVAHSQRHPEDLKTLQDAAATGKPVIAVLLSGRPLYVNDLLNLSQAFVAAWLPGSEGGGVADVLFGGAHDFRGQLGFPWPGQACPPPVAPADPARPPLFAVGYGLRYARGGRVGALPVQVPASCGAATTLPVFNLRDAAPFALKLAARGQERALGDDLNAALDWPQPDPALRVRTVQVNTQQDAKQVTWLAPARLFASSAGGRNLNALAQAQAALQFDVRVERAPTRPVTLRLGCVRGCGDGVDIAPLLAAAGSGKRTVTVPLACFAKRGADLGGIDMPFAVDADAPFAAAFTRIQVVAGAAEAADALRCE